MPIPAGHLPVWGAVLHIPTNLRLHAVERSEVLRFEWDSAQAQANVRKHGVSLWEAATAFGDPLSITTPDSEDSIGETRFVLPELSYQGRLMVVAHTDAGNSLRIISARLATRAERKYREQ